MFHFAAGHFMVEFVDKNIHALLSPKHLVLIPFWCQNYPSDWFLYINSVSLPFNRLYSGVHSCKFVDLFKVSHFCQILYFHSDDGDD